jgi:hypothetical protein
MSAERLRDISAGAAAGDHEWADIEFALVASGIRHQEHQELLDRLDQRTRRLFRLSATLWALVLVAAGCVPGHRCSARGAADPTHPLIAT